MLSWSAFAPSAFGIAEQLATDEFPKPADVPVEPTGPIASPSITFGAPIEWICRFNLSADHLDNSSHRSAEVVIHPTIPPTRKRVETPVL